MIEVFTKSDYSVGFRPRMPYKTPKAKSLPAEKPLVDPPEKNQQNNSSAVTVRLSGLNEAFNLGCITLTELHDLSKQLAYTAGALFIEIDDADNARYATYKDQETTFQIELQNVKSWTTLFDFIYNQKTKWTEKKAAILKPLTDHLATVVSLKMDPFKKCLKSLDYIIKNFKLVIYSQDDFTVHALKLNVAHYIKSLNPKKFLSLQIQCDPTNNLICIKNPDLTLFNLDCYLSENVLSNCNLPNPEIKSISDKLKNQKQKKNGKTVIQLCKERGKIFSQDIYNAWITLGIDFMNLFQYDIFSLPFTTLATLAYNVVWTQYIRQGGTFHHGIEKMKPFYENILRDYSNGGYYYSCQDKLDAQQPVHGNTGNPASSIMELDIISSYGYASSHMMTPTGFCVGYFQNEANQLEKCDKKMRHFSFEFLSVYYTLDQLTLQGYNIKTVYSNFHLAGIFTVDNYPIDLVVICANGQLLLFQFDGQVIFST